jgi:hypothetical protein
MFDLGFPSLEGCELTFCRTHGNWCTGHNSLLEKTGCPCSLSVDITLLSILDFRERRNVQGLGTQIGKKIARCKKSCFVLVGL